MGAAERFLFGDAPTWEVPTFWRQGSAGGHRRKGTAASKRRWQASSAPPGKLGRVNATLPLLLSGPSEQSPRAAASRLRPGCVPKSSGDAVRVRF